MEDGAASLEAGGAAVEGAGGALFLAVDGCGGALVAPLEGSAGLDGLALDCTVGAGEPQLLALDFAQLADIGAALGGGGGGECG